MATQVSDLRDRAEVWRAAAREQDGGATRAELTHRVVVREASLPDICREMYFVVRGLRLDVSYWLPIYSRRGWMEIFCTAHEGEVTADGT